mgnify:CR=1 FL=1
MTALRLSPCFGCADRHLACAARCERFAAWKTAREDVAARARADRAKLATVDDLTSRRVRGK